MDVLNTLGWQLCSRRLKLNPHWYSDLIYRKNNRLFILETKRPEPAAHITADLLGPCVKGFRLYYGYLDYGNSIGRIREWRPQDYIDTIFI